MTHMSAIFEEVINRLWSAGADSRATTPGSYFMVPVDKYYYLFPPPAVTVTELRSWQNDETK
jgi:hypothetical protein